MSASRVLGPAPVGVVLAGGRSSRLGRDKAGLLFHGRALLVGAAELLLRVAGEVWVAGRDPRPMGLDVPFVLDQVAGQGPAGGVLAALTVVKRPILAISCDLPFMKAATLETLLRARAERPAATLMTTFRQIETGYVESLTAVYEFEAVPVLAEALAAGQRKLSAIFPPSRRHHLDYSLAIAEPAGSFFNVNRPDDLVRAREMERAACPR